MQDVLVVMSLLLANAAPPAMRTSRTAQPAVARDVPFTTSTDRSQSLDFYRAPKANAPLVMYVHEGSLTSGDKADSPYDAIAQRFVARGYAVALINYRLMPAHPWPAQIDDVADAFVWLVSHADTLGIDASRMFVVGHSSGAQLATLLATDTTYLTRRHRSTRDIAGVVAMGSLLGDPLGLTELAADAREARFQRLLRPNWPSAQSFIDAWPMAHVQSGTPPMLVLIAEAEQVNPPILASAQTFAARLATVGGRADVRVLANRTHRTAVERMAVGGDETLALILQWMAEQ